MRRRFGYLFVALAATTLACSDTPSGPRTQPGTLVISIRRTGNAIDGDGFVLALGGANHRLAMADTLRVQASAGEHTIRISDIAPHCVTAADSARVVIGAAATTALQIDAECYGSLVYSQWYGPLDDALHYMDEQGQSRQLTAAMSGGQWQARWSPDGTHILFERMHGTPIDSDVWIADLHGNAWPVAARQGDRDMSPSWSADGQWVVYVHVEGLGLFTETDIRRVRPDGTEDHSLFRDGVSTSPVYSPDGQYIAFGCWRAEHGICYLTASGEFVGQAPARLPRPNFLVWSPDGSFIAAETFGEGQAIQLLRVGTGEASDVLPGQISFGHAYWTPDATRLALSVAEAGDNYPAYVVGASGIGLVRVADYIRWMGPWSPDGAKLPLGIQERAFHLMDGVTLQKRVLMSGNDEFVRGWWRPSSTASAPAVRGPAVQPRVRAASAAGGPPIRMQTDPTRMMQRAVAAYDP